MDYRDTRVDSIFLFAHPLTVRPDPLTKVLVNRRTYVLDFLVLFGHQVVTSSHPIHTLGVYTPK